MWRGGGGGGGVRVHNIKLSSCLLFCLFLCINILTCICGFEIKQPIEYLNTHHPAPKTLILSARGEGGGGRRRAWRKRKRWPRSSTSIYNGGGKQWVNKTEMTTMRVRQMQNLCIEIYKTLSNLNPEYMHELFERNSHTYSTRRPNNLKIPRVNQTSFGFRSIRAEGAKLWNHLPENIKSSENLSIFQNLIKQWNGPSCGCNYCLFVNNYSSNI